MVNSYSASGMYPQGNYYNQGYVPQRKSNPMVGVLGAMTLGAVGGGAAGYFLNKYPVNRNGEVSDEFAKKAFDMHIKKNLSKSAKKVIEQVNNVMEKIDSVNTSESLKRLLKSNPLALKMEQMGVSLETYVNSITADNLKETKQKIKKELQNVTKGYYEKFKTITKACWDNAEKKFIKPDGMESKIFNVIKKTTANNQWKKALKYGGITAGVMGALTLGYKMLTSRN